jgi:hypothetical protein
MDSVGMKESVTGRVNGAVKAHAMQRRAEKENEVADAITSQFPLLSPFYSTWVGEI